MDHNHNNLYYLKDETVNNSLALDGKDSSYFASNVSFNEFRKELDRKIDMRGGKMFGRLESMLKANANFKENEFVPLYYIKFLINKLKRYIDNDFYKKLNEENGEAIGLLNDLTTDNKGSIVSALNEIHSYIGNINELSKYDFDNIVSVLMKIIEVVGIKKLSNDKSVIEVIEYLIKNTATLDKECIFRVNPLIQNVVDLNTADKRTVLNLGDIERIVRRSKRKFIIDLSKDRENFAYPIVLNEDGLHTYTNTIITNEPDSVNKNAHLRISINGTGSAGKQKAPFLEVKHSSLVENKKYFVKKILLPAHSSAVVIYLRGGHNYVFELNGSDAEPIVVKESYQLQGSASFVNRESWDEREYILNGNWIFNNTTNALINYQLKPHFVYG